MGESGHVGAIALCNSVGYRWLTMTPPFYPQLHFKSPTSLSMRY